MSTKISLSLFLGIFISIPLFSQIPDNYYDNTLNKNGSELKQALYKTIKNQKTVSYGEARYLLEKTDLATGSIDSLRTIYTFQKSGATWDQGQTWNREHVWSKSRGFNISEINNDYKGVGSDLHNLRACIPDINLAKSNRWFAQAETIFEYRNQNTGSKTNLNNGAENWVWEPRDEDKGDVARILFYMATRYEGEDNEVDLELIDYLSNNQYASAPYYSKLSELLAWHLLDTVDQFERQRNESIFAIQQNRNPFIDHPEFAHRIFNVAITNVATNPNTPISSSKVKIQAIIFAQSKINTPITKWGYSVDALNNSIEMIESANGHYETKGAIPAQKQGTIYYQVQAIDTNNILYSAKINSYSIEQDIIFSEAFESSTAEEAIALNGWANTAEIGEHQWLCKSYNNNQYAQFTSYKSGEENECWLISPEINISNIARFTLSFDVNIGYYTHDALQIFICHELNTDNITQSEWINISDNFNIPKKPSSGYGDFASAGAYSITDFGDKLHIAFQYKGNEISNTTTVQIDNIQVKESNPTSSITQQNTISIYPNPANEMLYFTPYLKEQCVSIYNHTGNLVLTKNTYNNCLDVSTLQNGYYIVHYTQNGKPHSASFCVIK